MSAAQDTGHKLYFAYGSNLSYAQMKTRCPASVPVGLGHLRGWTWIINERGFANIVKDPAAAGSNTSATVDDQPKPMPMDATHDQSPLEPSAAASAAAAAPGVYGIIYTLPPADEDSLDLHEGVPVAYEKELLDVEIIKGSAGAGADAEYKEGEILPALVYIDHYRIKADSPRAEYVHRMNRGIAEAREHWGLPDWYVHQVMRNFIPETSLPYRRQMLGCGRLVR